MAASHTAPLTRMQFEEQLDDVVVQVTAVLDHLDHWRQPALPGGSLRHSDGGVELPEHCTQTQGGEISKHCRDGKTTPTCIQVRSIPGSYRACYLDIVSNQAHR